MNKAIILAAGKGVRMQSDLPKVFHNLCGKPMLAHVIDAVRQAGISAIYVVVGYKREIIKDYFKDAGVTFVEQNEQLGTGHAVLQVKPYLADFSGTVLILNGDVPLITKKTISELLDFHNKNEAVATVLTAKVEDAGNYGRIVRDESGRILRIVEKKDATAQELLLNEINTGTFCFQAQQLYSALEKVKAENAQKEYYLTDTIEILRREGERVFACLAKDYREVLGVNTKEELSALCEVAKSAKI